MSSSLLNLKFQDGTNKSAFLKSGLRGSASWRLLLTLASFPGEKHWHGAGPTTAMTHIAIQEKKDGKVDEWMEKVSDEQYRKS